MFKIKQFFLKIMVVLKIWYLECLLDPSSSIVSITSEIQQTILISPWSIKRSLELLFLNPKKSSIQYKQCDSSGPNKNVSPEKVCRPKNVNFPFNFFLSFYFFLYYIFLFFPSLYCHFSILLLFLVSYPLFIFHDPFFMNHFQFFISHFHFSLSITHFPLSNRNFLLSIIHYYYHYHYHNGVV